MLSEIDGMLQSLYMLNNTPVSDARRALVIREMNGNPDVNPEGSDTTTHAVNPLDFEVTVKSHKEITAKFWRDKQTRGVGEVLSPIVETTTGGVRKYSYQIKAGKSVQTYFRKKTSTRSPFDLRVFYVGIEDGEEVESDGATIPIKDEETETLFPVKLNGDDKDGWNIYLLDRLILQIRFHL